MHFDISAVQRKHCNSLCVNDLRLEFFLNAIEDSDVDPVSESPIDGGPVVNIFVRIFRAMLAMYIRFRRCSARLAKNDAFVEKNSIERVDFIKADVEGAERNMLRGAKRILRDFSPKLSLCSYHLPDDPQVLREIILDANPEYQIVEKFKNLYAYVSTKGLCANNLPNLGLVKTWFTCIIPL